jgi:hypothetical protein
MDKGTVVKAGGLVAATALLVRGGGIKGAAQLVKAQFGRFMAAIGGAGGKVTAQSVATAARGVPARVVANPRVAAGAQRLLDVSQRMGLGGQLVTNLIKRAGIHLPQAGQTVAKAAPKAITP